MEKQALVQSAPSGEGGLSANNNNVKYQAVSTENDEESNVHRGHTGEEVPSEHHSTSLRSMLFGGVEGMYVALAAFGAAQGIFPSQNQQIALCIAIVLSASLVTGIAEACASRSHKEFVDNGQRRVRWEFHENKDDERRKLIHSYQRKGMSHSDAVAVVNKLSQYEFVFIDAMLTEELGFKYRGEDAEHVLSDALVMLLSSFIFGSLPIAILVVIGILLDLYSPMITTIASLAILFALGSFKGIVARVSWTWAGAECTLIGALVYAVSLFASSWLFSLACQVDGAGDPVC